MSGSRGWGTWASAGPAPSLGFGGFVFSASSQSFNLLVRALKAQGRVEILSRPQVQVIDNQTGFIQVGQDFPTPTNVNVTGLTTQQGVEYRQIGVVMRVTPRITPDGKVIMRIEPQISSVVPTADQPGRRPAGAGLQHPDHPDDGAGLGRRDDRPRRRTADAFAAEP